MKTILLVVGRTVEQHYITAINDYIQRTKRYITFDMEVIPELKNTKSLSMEVQKEKEGELILKSLQPGDVIVLRDAFSRICRLYETKNEHSQQTASFHYRRPLWIFRKGISSSKRKNFNVENDFFASDDPINIRGADLSGNDDTEWRTVSS